jgi:hypothetical protein
LEVLPERSGALVEHSAVFWVPVEMPDLVAGGWQYSLDILLIFSCITIWDAELINRNAVGSA